MKKRFDFGQFFLGYIYANGSTSIWDFTTDNTADNSNDKCFNTELTFQTYDVTCIEYVHDELITSNADDGTKTTAFTSKSFTTTEKITYTTTNTTDTKSSVTWSTTKTSSNITVIVVSTVAVAVTIINGLLLFFALRHHKINKRRKESNNGSKRPAGPNSVYETPYKNSGCNENKAKNFANGKNEVNYLDPVSTEHELYDEVYETYWN